MEHSEIIAGVSALLDRRLRRSRARAFQHLVRGVPATIFASLLLIGPTPTAAQTASEIGMDRSVKPGDDFYRYANGTWLRSTTIPADRKSYDTRAMLDEKTSQRVSDLVQAAAATSATKGSVAQKVGDYYASFVDEGGIEVKGLTPLKDELARISAIKNKAALSAYLGSTLTAEVDGLTANADHIFGMWVNQGFQDANHNVVHVSQGGLGMPDRDDYLDPSPKMGALRSQYQAYIAAVLRLAGFANEETRAANVLSLEIRIAQAFAPDADAADVFKQNNPWKRSDFAVKAPGMDWDAYFQAAGLGEQPDFIVWQPSAVTGVSAMVNSENIEAWKDYLRFHLIEHYAGVLPRAVAAAHFAFYGTILSGTQQAPERAKLAIAATNGDKRWDSSTAGVIFRLKRKQERRRWLAISSPPTAFAFQISPGCLLRPKRKRWRSWLR